MNTPSASLRISSFALAALALLFLTAPAAAQEKRPLELASLTKLKPGATGLLKSQTKGMHYFIRLPRTYNPKTGARLIIFLHGSNMNGLSYLRSFEKMKWCEDDILACPNGENGADPFGACNFGFNSGPAVADVTEEIQKAFKTPITYIGGHSQGAFLTYSVILNHPDLYRGAFPMAGDCWAQNEPNLWEDKPDVLKKQMEIAIAVIHGKADPVVAFSQGEHAYDCFRAMGWTKLRLFAPKELNHMFMLAPIDEAIEWLDAMNGLNARKSLTLAAKWGKEGEWGWAWHVAKSAKTGGAALEKSAEAAATKALPTITEALKGKPADWIPKWTEYRRVYGETTAAKPLIAEQEKKRDEQRKVAGKLFNESQASFRAQKRDEGYKTLEKLRDEGPHTYEGYFAWKWLTERK